MPAAGLAVLAIASGRLVIHADVVRAFGDAHRVGLPQSERVDGRRRPCAAGIAVAISHVHRGTGNGDLHSAAETRSFVGSFGCHLNSPSSPGDLPARWR